MKPLLPNPKKRKELHWPNERKMANSSHSNFIDAIDKNTQSSHSNFLNKKPVCLSHTLPETPSRPYNNPSKIKKLKPCFSRKLKPESTALRRHNIAHKLLKANSQNQFSTFTEKRILRIRQKFMTNHNIQHIPNPITTHNIIYAGYRKSTQRSPIYIGKTTHSTLTRFLSETSSAYYLQSNNLSKFIKRIKPQNYCMIPLQSVPNWDMSQSYEHYWINVFQTQIPNYQKTLLYNITSSHKLNTCSKHSSLHPKLKYKPKFPLLSIPSKINLSKPFQKSVDTPVFSNQQNKRFFISRLWSDRIISLYKTLKSKDFNLSCLSSIKSKTLFKFISTITNKNINSYSTLRLNHILHLKQFKLFLLPSPSITLHHTKLLKTLTKTQLSKITHIILFELNSRHVKKPPKNFKISPSTLIPISLTTNLLNSLNYNFILKEAQKFLPFPYNINLQLSFKSKPSKPLSLLFDNSQSTVNLISLNYLNNLPECFCHLPQFSPFLNQYKHIDSNEFDFIYNFPSLKTFYDEISYVISLLNLGPNHRISYSPSPHLIKKIINDTILHYINNICTTNFLDDSLFEDWKQFILINCFLNLETLHLPNNFHPKTPSISSIIKILHQHFCITTTDKLKNNFRITCKKHYNLCLHKMISGHEIDLSQPTLPIPYLPSTKSGYSILFMTQEEILLKHKNFLLMHNFSFIPKLPRKIIQMKPHKLGYRPLVPANNISTTNMSKYLHLALKECLNQLKILNQKWSLKFNTNWFFHIDSTQDLTLLLTTLNKDPNYIPYSSQCGDISGFYDNINHLETIKLLNKTLTEIFSINKPFLIIKKKSKTAYWSSTNKPNSVYTYSFSLQSLLECLTWRIKNQIILHGDLILSQNIGIAQGDNHSPYLSILLLTIYERDFITFHTIHNPIIAKNFSKSVRKIDDILSLDNPFLSQYIYKDNNQPNGLYPRKFFTINLEPINQTNFLDVSINIIKTPLKFYNQNFSHKINTLQNYTIPQLQYLTKKLKISPSNEKLILINKISEFYIQNNKHLIINKESCWNTITYNKMEKHQFSFTNTLPHMSSDLPNSVKYGSFIGRLHSFTITNLLNFEDFLKTSSNLMNKLVSKNQYKYNVLETKLFNYIKTFLKNKYNVSPNEIINYYLQYLSRQDLK
jgi:hypothetical protein